MRCASGSSTAMRALAPANVQSYPVDDHVRRERHLREIERSGARPSAPAGDGGSISCWAASQCWSAFGRLRVRFWRPDAAAFEKFRAAHASRRSRISGDFGAHSVFIRHPRASSSCPQRPSFPPRAAGPYRDLSNSLYAPKPLRGTSPSDAAATDQLLNPARRPCRALSLPARLKSSIERWRGSRRLAADRVELRRWSRLQRRHSIFPGGAAWGHCAEDPDPASVRPRARIYLIPQASTSWRGGRRDERTTCPGSPIGLGSRPDRRLSPLWLVRYPGAALASAG